MRHQQREGFLLSSRDISNDILIPRYYDPRISESLDRLKRDYHLVSLRHLIADRHILHCHGDYVPKLFYGTGPYPYVRTSDLANWEIKASPKHGVPEAVYQEYSAHQGVCPRDIIFVHEGTYLIGSVAMVTEFDGPILYQHHLAKFTVGDSSPFNPYFLLAAFESPVVHSQIRARQFSADIIDSVVGRLEEVIIPYPKDARALRRIEGEIERAVTGRAKLRQQIAHAAEEVDQWLCGSRKGSLSSIFDWEPRADAFRQPALLGGRRGFSASSLKHSQIVNEILLPKYYDPLIPQVSGSYGQKCKLETLRSLVDAEIVSCAAGDEIGRLSYGTGDIPFVRTSDFGSWELKRESKQGVSEDVYRTWAKDQDVRPGDILMVRDGSYLVGTSVLVHEDDLPLLYCGGIVKIRSLDHDQLPPGLLFALLNTPFVKRQIRNKQFTRDVIDTLGLRYLELALPMPKEKAIRHDIGRYFDRALLERTRARSRLHKITKELYRP